MMTAFRFSWVDEYLKRTPSVVLDCGCYDATDAIAFKEKWPGARVIAFEACPDNYARIGQQGKARFAHVAVVHAAVCDHEKGVVFWSNCDTNQVASFGQSGSILQPTEKIPQKWPSISFKEPRQVPSVRLDAFCAGAGIGEVDLLHMDIQGAELFALRGLGDMRPAMIFLEIDETEEVGRYVGGAKESQVRAWFDGAGYRRVWDSEHDALYVHGTA